MYRKSSLVILILSLQLALIPYHLPGSEVDQFTDREKYQDSALDFTERINQYTNSLIEKGVDNFNREYQQKKLTMDEIHRYAAFEIYKTTAWINTDKHNYPDIPSRVNLLYALLYKSGQGPIQKWIKKEENNAYRLWVKDNIYSNTYPDFANKNVIIKVGGEFIGSDKVDHFFDQGYSYWIKSDFGLSDLKAKEYGVDSENSWYGLAAGGVFSFADLRVNWGGYQFYKNLFLGENSLLLVSKDGIVSMRHSFDWSEHIDWQFDELRNPSNYSSLMKRRIQR
ncbi:MAG: hypothetical protein U9N32_04935, partial [Spirochaetota bacterium]|nr:hypothetical protein [Spirochaetota bacterium]